MEIIPGITINDGVQFGRPVIKGTRVPVELVLGKLAAGMTYEQIIAEYDLRREDILAALDYAARLIATEEIRASGLHA